MANTAAAKKAIRSSARKAAQNELSRSKFKEARKAVRKALVAGDKKTAAKSMSKAMKAIDKAAKTNILHPNTAARYKSRLAKALAKAE